jgi:hypothetical protein
MTQAIDKIALAEQACIESHLPPDPKAAALFVALKSWHLAALHRDHNRLLPDLYPLLHQFSQLSTEQQQQLNSRFAFSYALRARSEQQQLADALCHAVLWQRYEQLCQCLKTGDSNVRLEALCWGYRLRRQLPWQQAVPALLNNVCDKIFDVDLSIGLAWWLLIRDGHKPWLYMKTFMPDQRLLLQQYFDRLEELLPDVEVHLAKLSNIQAPEVCVSMSYDEN